MTAAGARAGVGASGLTLPRLGVGTAPLGDVFGRSSDEDAVGLLSAMLDAGLDHLDTAPLYGLGLAEARVGRALRELGQPQVVISTKVGRVLDESQPAGWRFDFTADGIRRSLDASLARLGRDRVDIIYLHDPDNHEDELYAQAWPTLERLRDEGVVRAIGIGVNRWQLPLRLVQRADVDLVLLAGRYTLLDQGAAEDFLPACAAADVSVVLAGVFNSGVLADPRDGAWYDYVPASGPVLARARAIQAVVAEYGLDLPTAALRFAADAQPLTTVLVGMGTASVLRTNLDAWSRQPVGISWAALWRRLAALGLTAAA